MAPRQRLQICLVVSTIVVAGLLMLVRLPQPAPPTAMPLLVVDIVETVAVAVEPAEPSVPVVTEPSTIVATEQVPTEPPKDELREPTDWHAEIKIVVAASSLPSAEKPVFNVAQAEQRRQAAEQFAPIPSHEPVPIWDNVIEDATGRSVLQHGDCQRVIDDPNASTREAFETFGQYIVTCSSFKEKPKKLAWVSELESRRAGPSRYGRPLVE